NLRAKLRQLHCKEMVLPPLAVRMLWRQGEALPPAVLWMQQRLSALLPWGESAGEGGGGLGPALGPALHACPDFGDIVGDQVRLPPGYGRVLRAIAVGRHHGGHAGGLAGLYVALVVTHVKAVLRL